MSFQERIDRGRKRPQKGGRPALRPSPAMQGDGCNPMPVHTHTRAMDGANASHEPTRDYIEETRAFWQPYAREPLSREDAREIIANVSGFFRVLRAWAEEDKRIECASK